MWNVEGREIVIIVTVFANRFLKLCRDNSYINLLCDKSRISVYSIVTPSREYPCVFSREQDITEIYHKLELFHKRPDAWYCSQHLVPIPFKASTH